MRGLLLVLLVLAAGGGAYYLLGREECRTPPEEVVPGDRQGGTGLRPSVPGEPGVIVEKHEAPRVGVMSRLDRDLVADPEATPWHMRMLSFSAGAGVHLTGKMLVDAVAKHLYVRARDQATLDALLAETFEVEANHEMPLGAVVRLLSEKGYEVEVQDPRFMVRRAPK